MSADPNSGPPRFTLQPTDHPLQLRLEFYDPSPRAHTLIVEPQLFKKFAGSGASQVGVAAAAVELALDYDSRFNFPTTFSLGLLTRVFPDLLQELAKRLLADDGD